MKALNHGCPIEICESQIQVTYVIENFLVATSKRKMSLIYYILFNLIYPKYCHPNTQL